MTANNVYPFGSEDPLEELASDLWRAGKSISALTDEEQLEAWRQAVEVLHDFGKLAETLHNDALLLAVTDAKDRAEEEYERAFDRLNRSEGAEFTAREDERLHSMIRRSDALGEAYRAYEETPHRYPDIKAEYLAVLGELKREASDALRRYQLELGLPAPGA